LLLAVVLLWAASRTSPRPGAPVAGNAPDPTIVHGDAGAGAAVARTWAELRRQQAAEAPPPVPPPDLARGGAGFGVEDVAPDEVGVPPWLLTAFSAPNRTN
jgi:hypothetical protein